MITEIEDFFTKGCGRCARFDTPDCSARVWGDGLLALRALCREAGLVETVKWGHPCYMHAGRNVALIGALRGDFRLNFFEACTRLNVPLFIHPGPAGLDGPAGDPRLRRYDLDVVIGFAAQETIAVASLIYGGVLDRHPALDICISHGGGSSAYLLGRLARAARKRPWAAAEIRPDGAFEERYRRLWFDTHLNSDRSVAFFVETVGRDRLVYGTNFVGWDAPDVGAGHAPDPYLADNARRLLRVTD